MEGMFERCMALSDEDKKRNIESEELDLSGLEWGDDEDEEACPSQLFYIRACFKAEKAGLIITPQPNFPGSILTFNSGRPSFSEIRELSPEQKIACNRQISKSIIVGWFSWRGC